MIVGLPKEIKNNESRVAITPGGVFELTKNDHEVYVQTRAGFDSGFSDNDYISAGAKILPSIEEVYAIADMIVKLRSLLKKNINWQKKVKFFSPIFILLQMMI